jgi:DNA-binding winged helix-turn-helix (wHTH) protein
MSDPSVQFGDFCFAPGTGGLTRAGRVIPLEHQPALVLARLLASPGRLVTRGELAAATWADGTHVNFDDGLNYCIRHIRAALGDDPKAPRFIETIPRRGYRFIAPVVASSTRPAFGRRRLAGAAAVAAAIVLTAFVESRPNNHHQIAVSVVRAVHDLIF